MVIFIPFNNFRQHYFVCPNNPYTCIYTYEYEHKTVHVYTCISMHAHAYECHTYNMCIAHTVLFSCVRCDISRTGVIAWLYWSIPIKIARADAICTHSFTSFTKLLKMPQIQWNLFYQDTGLGFTKVFSPTQSHWQWFWLWVCINIIIEDCGWPWTGLVVGLYLYKLVTS